MQRRFIFSEEKIICPGTPKGVLTNGFGSYFCLDNDMSYQGWYLHETDSWRMQKIIESIIPLEEGEITDFTILPYALRRQHEKGAQETFMVYSDILLYSTTKLETPVRLTLDHRESYETSRVGRHYEIYEEHNALIIKFTQEHEYEHYLVIKGIKGYHKLQLWREKQYETDASRGTQSSYWVFDAIDFVPEHNVVFAAAKTYHEAITLASIGYVHFDEIQTTLALQSTRQLFSYPQIKEKRIGTALTLSAKSLLDLTPQLSFNHQTFKGMYAGLPWFFQIWSRDELISIGGLFSLAKERNELFHVVKAILNRHVHGILHDGKLANRYPHSDLGSIDAFGWLAYRTYEFLDYLFEHKLLYSYFSPQELQEWLSHFKTGIQDAVKATKVGGFFSNKFNETWMDTSHHDDGRAGIRIEIQALHYAVYNVICQLAQFTEDEGLAKYYEQKEEFKDCIRMEFLDNTFDGVIIDGYNFEHHKDKSIRPNVFLAAYVAPDLFTNDELERMCDYYLQQLWQDWGGLATLSKESSLFQPMYTGQNNMSYHRGDSWHFVNHLAACMLLRVNKDKYNSYVEQIIRASTKDILELGWAAHMSELSSATRQDASASLMQTWSVATFIELVKKKHNIE